MLSVGDAVGQPRSGANGLPTFSLSLDDPEMTSPPPPPSASGGPGGGGDTSSDEQPPPPSPPGPPRARSHSRSAAPSAAASASASSAAARLKADFEHSLVACLLFNTLYLYYCDARLLVLFIRSSQILRLLYFPYETPAAQRSTALLLLMSNIPVLLIHAAIIVDGNVGDMLLINFIGPEPHPLAKLFYVDFVTMALQATLASVSGGDQMIVSSLPVAPASVARPETAPADAPPSGNDDDAPTSGMDGGGQDLEAAIANEIPLLDSRSS